MADISGAFDKVARERILWKLAGLGVAPAFLDFLNSYLLPREGRVAVEGAMSESMTLCDMVYQGTVLGPTLWNSFFGDVVQHVASDGQHVSLFADDLSVSARCPVEVSDAILLEELSQAQSRAHQWGNDNQVTFEPAKEHIRIIHPDAGTADTFRMLGVLLDGLMSMTPCLDEILHKISPKVRAMLRTSFMYSREAMLGQYKAHVWSRCEYSSGVVLTAVPSQLHRLDDLQRRFLQELGLDEATAFIEFNFAPPGLRRTIGILGFLHKRVLGKCHSGLRSVAIPYQYGLQVPHERA